MSLENMKEIQGGIKVASRTVAIPFKYDISKITLRSYTPQN